VGGVVARVRCDGGAAAADVDDAGARLAPPGTPSTPEVPGSHKGQIRPGGGQLGSSEVGTNPRLGANSHVAAYPSGELHVQDTPSLPGPTGIN
jgi:hypothetical protein